MAEIHTPRLVLRSVRPEDAAQWRAFVGDPEVARWTASWAHPIDEEFLANRLGTPFPPERGVSVSIWRGDEIIGAAALTDGELGYMLRRDAFGLGYATEVARALIDHGFNALGLTEITAGTMDGNQASEHVLEKLGFVRTGAAPFSNAFSGRDLPGTDWRLTTEARLAADPIFVTTKRLRLRNITADDAPRLRQIVTHPRVGPMLVIYPPDWTDDDAREHVTTWSYQGRLRFRLGIERDGALIGAIGAGDGDEPSIFYFLDPALHGQGFATEIVPAFTAALFRRFPIAGLKAGVFADNPHSARVLMRAGFAEVGRGQWKSAARSAEAEMINFHCPRC